MAGPAAPQARRSVPAPEPRFHAQPRRGSERRQGGHAGPDEKPRVAQPFLQPAGTLLDLYGEDIRDPGLYDVVLNLDVISLEGACACVVGLAQRPEFEITPAVLARLEDFAVGCRVEVALLAAPATRALDLQVSVLGGVATVRGEVPDAAMVTDLSKRWEDDVRPVVEAVRGVKGVDLRLRAVYPHA